MMTSGFENKGGLVSKDRLYLTDSGEVVTEGGRYLIAVPGQPIPGQYRGKVAEYYASKEKTKKRVTKKKASSKRSTSDG